MNFIACFGPGFGTGDVFFVLGMVMAVEAVLAGVVALVISQACKLPMQKAFGVEALALLVCGVISVPLGGAWIAVLAWLGAFVCGCLLALSWLYKLMKGEQGSSAKQDFCFLELTDRSTGEAAKQ